ncbi:MAG: hypothetical protein AABZ00_08015 [Chloroflexota bacterium]
MTTKPNRYFWIVILLFSTACGGQAGALPADTTVPVVVSPNPIPTFTLIPVIVTPSPLPTQPPIPIITPDTTQVERWKEYETALAAGLLFPPKEFLCEWDILGMSEQVLYVWVVCESITPFSVTKTGRNIYLSSSTPALIHLGKDGVIQNVEVPGPGISDYQRMFPVYIQGKFEAYRFGKAKELSNHIEWRRFHPEEPPLNVLSAIPTP